MDASGIAPLFRGTSVPDGLKNSHAYAFPEVLCTIHHVRERTFVGEELTHAWARSMKDLLLERKAEVELAKARGQHELERPVLAEVLHRDEKILRAGYQANPPPPPPKKSDHSKRKPGRATQRPARHVLDRFSQKKRAVLRFLFDCAVPCDNNLAERDLRMLKVQHNVSVCFRTEQGITMCCRIRRSLSTLRKQQIALLSALELTLSGHPVLPTF